MKAPRLHHPVSPHAPLRHSFAEGCHYENMKGSYEVLSVDGTTMKIRWENGEESVTDLELQDRIQTRIEREARAAKVRPGAEREGGEHCFRPPFRGLAPTDFTQEVAQTTWRYRVGGLGGAVTEELDSGELCFASWAQFCKPMVHWADVDRRNRGGARVKTGFFCRLDEADAHYGFFVEASSEADGKGDWHRFLEWLEVPEHEAWLRSVAAE